jgi:lysozyme
VLPLSRVLVAISIVAAFLWLVMKKTPLGSIVNSLVSSAQNLIIRFEGFSDRAYKDTGGVWTIGYGHVIQSHEQYLMTKTITRQEADLLLIADMQNAINCVNSYVRVPLTNNQRDALISFTFNVGCEALKGSTLLKKLNAFDYSGAAAEFDRWVYDNGKVISGLVNRRSEEKRIFLS